MEALLTDPLIISVTSYVKDYMRNYDASHDFDRTPYLSHPNSKSHANIHHQTSNASSPSPTTSTPTPPLNNNP